MASAPGVRSRLREILVLALAVLTLAGCSLIAPSGSPAPSRPLQPVGTLQPMTTLPAVDPASGLPVVALAALPPEAAGTVALIDAGGPFPYRQDGATFGNREGLLPRQADGYYREYTVVTPGSADRGARRIVVSADGEMYWTADHYDSFAWIAR